jgi:non-specific serine/threonine protein kinase
MHLPDLLNNLENKSLVLRQEQGDVVRYRMLEPVRQYANHKLMLINEVKSTQSRHAEYFAVWSAKIEPKFWFQVQQFELDEIQIEYANFRAALEWATNRPSGWAGGNLGATSVQLVGGLYAYWTERGYLTEGLEWCQRVLGQPSCSTRTWARAKVLECSATFNYLLGNLPAARTLLEESVAIFREVGNKQSLARALLQQSYVEYGDSDLRFMQTVSEESLALAQELRDEWVIAESLRMLGNVMRGKGEYEHAGVFFQECLARVRRLNSLTLHSFLLRDIAFLAYDRGQPVVARRLFEQSLEIARGLGHKVLISFLLQHLANLHKSECNYPQAISLFREGLAMCWELGKRNTAAFQLIDLAALAMQQADPERAARLFGAGEAILESDDLPIPHHRQQDYARAISILQEHVGEAYVAAARSEGRAMTLEQAIAYALEDDDDTTASDPAISSVEPLITTDHS